MPVSMAIQLPAPTMATWHGRSNTIGTTGIGNRVEVPSMPAKFDGEPARTLDVRALDGEPFGIIMKALDALGEDETLLLVNGFEPEPLYGVLRNRGFDYEAERIAEDEWHVAIGRV